MLGTVYSIEELDGECQPHCKGLREPGLGSWPEEVFGDEVMQVDFVVGWRQGLPRGPAGCYRRRVAVRQLIELDGTMRAGPGDVSVHDETGC